MAQRKAAERGKSSRFGEYDVVEVGKLNCFTHIQREASPERVKAIAEDWQDNKAGILLVALLTDGKYAGEWHVYDGGTRRASCELRHGPTYEMPCWLREMTEQEAADEMLTFNMESRKPGQYDLFRIGLEAGRAPMIAVKAALDALKLEAGSTANYSTVAALGKCLTIVERYVDSGHTFDESAKHLKVILEITRGAYKDKTAHKGDLLQAIHRLVIDNQTKLAVAGNRKRLTERLARMELVAWETKVTTVKTMGGSDSRGNYLSHFIGEAYNKHLPENKKLVLPRFAPTPTIQVRVGVDLDAEAEAVA